MASKWVSLAVDSRFRVASLTLIRRSFASSIFERIRACRVAPKAWMCVRRCDPERSAAGCVSLGGHQFVRFYAQGVPARVFAPQCKKLMSTPI